MDKETAEMFAEILWILEGIFLVTIGKESGLYRLIYRGKFEHLNNKIMAVLERYKAGEEK